MGNIFVFVLGKIVYSSNKDRKGFLEKVMHKNLGRKKQELITPTSEGYND